MDGRGVGVGEAEAGWAMTNIGHGIQLAGSYKAEVCDLKREMPNGEGKKHRK